MERGFRALIDSVDDTIENDSQYPIRCMHKMILDVWKYYFDEKDE